MEFIPTLLKELEQEAQTTRKMLSLIPDDKYDWQPHIKSMTIRQLSTHIAELPTWVSMALNTDGLDFNASPYAPAEINSTQELMALFEESLSTGRERLAAAKEEELLPTWTLRAGEQVLYAGSTYETIRMSYSQIVHHRAQMGMYLRLLNIPIPGSYGPSADEM